MRPRRTLAGEAGPAEINMSPLIDMVFILLIFFIVTTEFVEERGIGVTKPQATAATTLDERTLVFVLTPGGEVLFHDTPVGTGGVAAVVRRASRQRDVPVVVEVRHGVVANLVVRVIDEARLGGATNVSLGTGS